MLSTELYWVRSLILDVKRRILLELAGSIAIGEAPGTRRFRRLLVSNKEVGGAILRGSYDHPS